MSSPGNHFNNKVKDNGSDDDDSPPYYLSAVPGIPTCFDEGGLVEGSQPHFRAAVMAPMSHQFFYSEGSFEDHIEKELFINHEKKSYRESKMPALPSPESQLTRASIAPGWKLEMVVVLALPVYYQLESTSVEFSQSKLRDVLMCLVTLFRTNSLKVDYKEGSEANTAAAFCESMEGLFFCVQFWKLNNSNYVAEVQRTAGDSMLFCRCQYAKRVLQAVKDAPDSTTTCMVDPLNVSLAAAQEQQHLLDSLKNGLDVATSPSCESTHFASHKSSENEINCAVSTIEEWLISPRCDHFALALTSLMALTDTNSSGYTTAVAVARNVLGVGMQTAVSEIILSLAFNGHWPESIEKKCLSMTRDAMESVVLNHAFIALTIVAQAVNVLDDNDMKAFVDRAASVLGSRAELVKRLLRAVDSARSSPHAAYLAAHSLARLCHALPDIRAYIQDNEIVKQAETYGRCSHAALERASGQLLQELEARGH